jgi:hypothetical protein
LKFFPQDCFVITDMVNNGEKYVYVSAIRFDSESRVTPSYMKNDRAFSIVGRRGRERIFNAKSRAVAATWTSNIDAAIRSVK